MQQVTIETIFADGTSHAHSYRFSTVQEALQHAWHEARLTGKTVRAVHVL